MLLDLLIGEVVVACLAYVLTGRPGGMQAADRSTARGEVCVSVPAEIEMGRPQLNSRSSLESTYLDTRRRVDLCPCALGGWNGS